MLNPPRMNAAGKNTMPARMPAIAIDDWFCIGRRIVARYTGNGYGHQARAVADAVAGGLLEHPVMPLAESVEIMDLVDRARACWGRGVRDR